MSEFTRVEQKGRYAQQMVNADKQKYVLKIISHESH